MKARLPTFLLHLTVILIALAVDRVAFCQESAVTQEDPVVASKEYFVQQQPGEAVVVKISGFEANFTSRLSTENDDLKMESGLPEGQTLPVFQFVVVSDVPRQVNIGVDATRVTNRTEFELGLTRLNVRDDRTAGIARAYRLLSDGLELFPGGNSSDWSVRVQTLFGAATLFQEIGMEEMRLWSRLFGAHLILHRMRDFSTAFDWATELLAGPRISRYPDITFAALKLRSSAMAAGRIGVGGADPLNSDLQQALEATATSARSLGYALEEALALKASGIDLLDHGLHRQAMQRFNAALTIAVDIAAGDLAAEIREYMVDIHAQAGDLESSGDVLQDIEAHLAQEGEDQELAVNLLRQGKLLIDGYRYSEAVAVLSRATRLEQSSLTRLEAELALGHALSASGQNDQALIHLNRGVLQPQSGGYRRPSDVLDVDAALDQIAAIRRFQENWNELEEIRNVQMGFSSGSATLAYQRALDSLQRFGASSIATRNLFMESLRQAINGGNDEIRALARLGLCALPGMADGVGARCEERALSADLKAVQETGNPGQVMHATLFYSQWLDQGRRISDAFRTLDQQMDVVIATGYEPLGAWFWQWRESFVGHYINLAIRLEGGDSNRNAFSSLFALARARSFERGREAVEPGFTRADLESFIRNLPDDTVVLSYFIGQETAFAWVAKSDGVTRVAIAARKDLSGLGRDLRHSFQSGSWARFDELSRELGSALLQPVAAFLERTILLVSHGALLGIPFDSLHLDGSPISAEFRLAYLDAFPAFEQPVFASFQPPTTTFLAGDPQDWSGDFVSRLVVSDELRSVSEQFVGPGLHVVQGVALLSDEFQDQRYALADLVHLSVPGIVDLSPARDSSLFLSEPVRGAGRERLQAGSLAGLPVAARLVFLSRTEFVGDSASMESRLGIISSILSAGADAVIASLWPLDAAARQRFVADFYNRLDAEQNIVAALTRTKRELQNHSPREWAGFQLFIN